MGGRLEMVLEHCNQAGHGHSSRAPSTFQGRFVKTQILALTPALLNQISGEGLKVPRFKQVA